MSRCSLSVCQLQQKALSATLHRPVSPEIFPSVPPPPQAPKGPQVGLPGCVVELNSLQPAAICRSAGLFQMEMSLFVWAFGTDPGTVWGLGLQVIECLAQWCVMLLSSCCTTSAQHKTQFCGFPPSGAGSAGFRRKGWRRSCQRPVLGRFA